MSHDKYKESKQVWIRWSFIRQNLPKHAQWYACLYNTMGITISNIPQLQIVHREQLQLD